MPERDRSLESFGLLRLVQQELGRQGYAFYPVEKEHTEALLTAPLLHRLRTRIKQRGFGTLAGRTIITFSGYAADPREIYAIPEIRAYWRNLDAELPELPALLAYLPAFNFNGPSQYVVLLGEIAEVRHHPEQGGDDVFVRGGEQILAQALARIRQAGATYRLSQQETEQLLDTFAAGASRRVR